MVITTSINQMEPTSSPLNCKTGYFVGMVLAMQMTWTIRSPLQKFFPFIGKNDKIKQIK